MLGINTRKLGFSARGETRDAQGLDTLDYSCARSIDNPDFLVFAFQGDVKNAEERDTLNYSGNRS